MKTKKEIYKIRPLVKEDAKYLNNWGSFNNPLFYGYEYNDLTDKEIDVWYRMKTKYSLSEYYSIFINKNQLIAYVGLKEINKNLNISKFGIVMDPNYVSKGYGMKIMEDFLNYVFNEKKLRRLDLEVNSWNIRAIKLYKKLGFKIIDEQYIKFENQEFDIEEDIFSNVRDSFKIINNIIYSKVYIMKLKRQEYLNEGTNR